MRPRVLKVDVAGQGEPVVLVPGGLTGWVSWMPHQERLAGRYQAIRVQPIHNEMGSAGIPGDPTYTRDVERECMRLTIEQMEIESLHLVGWSAGGKTALDFALSAPEIITSLTLVEPAAYWVLDEVDAELQQFIQHLHSLAGKTITEDDLATFLAKAGFAEDPEAARRDSYWEKALPHRMALSWLSEDLMGSDWSLADLARLRAPVLLTKGTRTETWERRVVDLLGEHLPNARVVDIEGTHAHHIESIDRFLEELETQLAMSPEIEGAPARTGVASRTLRHGNESRALLTRLPVV